MRPPGWWQTQQHITNRGQAICYGISNGPPSPWLRYLAQRTDESKGGRRGRQGWEACPLGK